CCETRSIIKLTANLLVSHLIFSLRPCIGIPTAPSCICLSRLFWILATAGWDDNIRVFGWKKLKPLAVLQHHTDMVNSVAFSDHQDPPQRLLAAGSKDQRISVWPTLP
uniref:Uncharacterized protein n=1 Tax=Cyprinus carpio TaxID=7962 RepID=A0A8C2JM91_CYPCA